ncbi:E3 ubiquitin-protein ligase TRAIP-like isoform X1 [Acropora palmata]
MPRAKCNICTESIQDGAACCPCGHVYHLQCINRWLEQSRSCPTCRKSTSKATVLFFDTTNLDISCNENDIESLKSRIEELKSFLNQKDVEISCIKQEHKKDLAEQIALLQKQNCCDVEIVKKQYERKLQLEKTAVAGLKKQLSYLRDKETELAVAQSQASELSASLSKLKRMKVLIDEHTDEAETMLRNLDATSFPEVIVQLITLKRKLEEKRQKCKEAIETTDLLKKENIRIKTQLNQVEMELQKSKDNLKMAEEDIQRLEEESSSYKKRLTAMERAFASPSPRSSAIGRLIRESPAPADIKRPRLSCPSEKSESVIVAETPPPKRGDREYELNSIAEEMGLSLVKTTSLASPIQRVPLKSTQQQSRKTAEHSVASVFRRGYDGLGGHTKFLAPSRPTKKAVRKVAKPIGVSKFIKHSTFACAEPPLPVMDLDAT